MHLNFLLCYGWQMSNEHEKQPPYSLAKAFDASAGAAEVLPKPEDSKAEWFDMYKNNPVRKARVKRWTFKVNPSNPPTPENE